MYTFVLNIGTPVEIWRGPVFLPHGEQKKHPTFSFEIKENYG